jgi:hypothetical protein
MAFSSCIRYTYVISSVLITGWTVHWQIMTVTIYYFIILCGEDVERLIFKAILNVLTLINECVLEASCL